MQEVANLQTVDTDKAERKNEMMPPKEESNLLTNLDLSLVLESVLDTSILDPLTSLFTFLSYASY